MGLIEFTMGYISSIAIYARLSELNAPPVLCLVLGLAAGLAAAFVLGYWRYSYREEKKKQKKRNRQHCTQRSKYDGQSFEQNYERLGKRLGIEGKQEPEQNKPVRKVCGALSEDFAKLSENERRAFFEGVI